MVSQITSYYACRHLHRNDNIPLGNDTWADPTRPSPSQGLDRSDLSLAMMRVSETSNVEDTAKEDHDADEGVPLQQLQRSSAHSARSSDFDHLLSEDASEVSSTAFPPIDGGRGAWLFLLGLWLLEAMLWGFPLSFGVFQEYYSNHELFRDSGMIPTVGSLATGLTYLGMPLANPIAIRWPQHRRKMCAVGYTICVISLIVASFARQTWHLLLSQGLLYGIGWVICYVPFLFLLTEWWVEKRGLAYGMLNCASGVSGLIIPIAFSWTLRTFGFRHALRAYALATLAVAGPGFLLIKPRLPATDTDRSPGLKKNDAGLMDLLPYLRTAHFALLGSAVALQGFGFFTPNTWIPSYATDLGLPNAASVGLLAILSASQVIGQLVQGWASDHVQIYILAAVTALVPGLGALFLWGPAKGTTFLALFSVLWGLFSSSYTILFVRMCTFLLKQGGRVVNEDHFMLLYGVLHVERGIANVLEGPISSWLITPEELHVRRYGLGKYTNVVWFTFICMLSSSFVGVGWFIRRAKS